MNRELEQLCRQLYGKGVSGWVYVRLMSRDLRIPEHTIARWWQDGHQHLPPQAKSALLDLLTQRGKDKIKAKKMERL